METVQQRFFDFLFDKDLLSFELPTKDNSTKKPDTFYKKDNCIDNQLVSLVFYKKSLPEDDLFIGIIIYSENKFYKNTSYLLPISVTQEINLSQFNHLESTLLDRYNHYKNYLKETLQHELDCLDKKELYNKGELITSINNESIKIDIVQQAIEKIENPDKDSSTSDSLFVLEYYFLPDFNLLDFNQSLFIGLLVTPEKTIDDWCKQYVLEKKSYIANAFTTYKKIVESRDNLLADPQFKKLLDCFILAYSKQAKTVTLHYKKDNKEIAIVIDFKYFDITKDYIPYQFVLRRKTTAIKYKQLFGEQDIQFEYIERISRGKTTLYTK